MFLPTSFRPAILAGFLLALFAAHGAAASSADREEGRNVVRHELVVFLVPAEGRLSATDRLTVGADAGEVMFQLHAGLRPSSPTPGVRLEKVPGSSAGPPFAESWAATLPPGVSTLVIEYGGRISHPLEEQGKEYARGFSMTAGSISAEGVFLAGSSFWYPVVAGRLVTFTLDVSLPAGWESVSQGDRIAHGRGESRSTAGWRCASPQEEIYLVAGRYTEYSRKTGSVEAIAFLRAPDAALAERYLEATGTYIEMYEGLIGLYPFGKFALVENFWETGLGMPSFTLLGPKVIRFPFILRSSYPHEILHNWWGNGVYPVYEKGNWSEGLTAYLSDHLLREQERGGGAYRQEALQKYADYVREGKDFPLSEFRSRHSQATEAVGYGKSLMLFHMLRGMLGDEAFAEGLRELYRRHRFGFAAFDDVRAAFEDVSGLALDGFFRQWAATPGAPELEAGGAKSEEADGGHLLRVSMRQGQAGPAYSLRVPVAVTMEGMERAHQETAVLDAKSVELTFRLPARPLRVDVDPEYDVFRRLDPAEVPPALSEAFGAEDAVFILPSSVGDGLLGAYRRLAEALGRSGPARAEVILDSDLDRLPPGKAVFVMGWSNRHLGEVNSDLSARGATVGEASVTAGGQSFERDGHTVVLAGREGGRPLVWIASDLPGCLPGLGRKLPHYHKYSYLVFRGEEPENVAKGRWPVSGSPMTLFLPAGGKTEKVGMGRLAVRRPLAALPEAISKDEMMRIVVHLSSPDLEGRGVGTQGLGLAAEFVARKFEEAGLAPAAKDGFLQAFQAEGPDGEVILHNVLGVLPGRNPKYAGESVVLGAHYDHLGRGWPAARAKDVGEIHPGADDNASGVAVLLEVARVMAKGAGPERTVVFAAFSGEEAGWLGSTHYVNASGLYPASRAIGMVNLDTVGRLGAGKLLVLGAASATEWTHIVRGAGYVAGVGVETVKEPLDASDQAAFHEAGVPAVQLFTGPHLDYHRPSDTADKIDPDGLVSVARVAREVVAYLAGREGPLEAALAGAPRPAGGRGRERKVSLGTVPDFAFGGEGCRISGTVPGSPAEKAGLKEGDIIVAVDFRPVASLGDLSEVLKDLSPGKPVTVTFLRDGEKMEAAATLEAR